MRPREVRPLLRHPLAVRYGIACLFGVLAAAAAPGQLVERVVDGDTIIVEGVGRVRLIGVDTPETVHPNRPVEFFGKEASARTGRKYHREGCRFLSKSMIPMKRNEAVERYEPCGVCKPD